MLDAKLGLGYDVVIEKTHVHCEWDVKPNKHKPKPNE